MSGGNFEEMFEAATANLDDTFNNSMDSQSQNNRSQRIRSPNTFSFRLKRQLEEEYNEED